LSDYKITIAKPIISDDEKNAVLEVLSSGNLVQGKKVEEFEKKFAEYIGVRHCIAVNSGTAALHLGLLSLGIKKGDEVITTPFSFTASGNCVLYCGATPVFADIDIRDFNIDPKKVEEKITERTKCIIPVHLFGHPAKMDLLKELSEKHNLHIVEDAAQAHGSEFRGQKIGTIGDVGCFSFYPTKNITTGEGGAITTNDDDIAEKVRLLRNHGQHKQYYQRVLGFNFRMTDIVAAIGVAQLKKIEEFNKIRIENARRLTDGLKDLKNIVTPSVDPSVKHVFHQYTIRIAGADTNISRDVVKEKLQESGIQTKIYYPVPIHKQELYQNLGYDRSIPVAEAASKEVLSIPVHPSLTEKDIEFILEKIREIVKS
jgi:dTDP-4-amino-4,6-dideoxygalactose transaminase